MKRSMGVTVIAVLSLVGSAFMLLMGIVMLAVTVFAGAPNTSEFPGSPIVFKLILAGAALIYLLLAAWGISTGVGLLRLSQWARISTIVFSALLVLTSGFSALTSLMLPSVVSSASTIDPSVAGSIRLFMGAFWSGILGVGIWWLIFLSRASVKAQFAGPGSPVPPPLPETLSLAAQTPPIQRPPRKRPLSFTIIAWVLLSGCLFMPLNLALRFPAILFNKMLTGWSATVLYFLFTVVSLYVGIGLLRFKRFARVAGIAYFTFAFVNSAIFYYAPGARGRLRALLDADQTIFPWMRLWPSKPESQIDIVPILLLGGALGLILLAVPLYFLVTRKQAFEEAAQAL